MTQQEFEELFELETVIRQYKHESELLDYKFLNKKREIILVINLELKRNPLLDLDSSVEDPLPEESKYEIWGAGDHEASEEYSTNARIMRAGVEAMLKEMNDVIIELESERNKKLNN
ncbi:hypothetical protein [Runella sp. SP2]|uniref:hypothetical protein n=1 Tax=Runella sp. SP2 TaxID=2268026 RepID=UPI0013DE0879|nr:hypothetical protein [Runella sp. SP2]